MKLLIIQILPTSYHLIQIFFSAEEKWDISEYFSAALDKIKNVNIKEEFNIQLEQNKVD
jgi:hypothetical protein